MVEEVLELFVSQIDADLLKPVHSEVLETKDVKYSCINKERENLNVISLR